MREISTSYIALTFEAEVGAFFRLDSIKDLQSGHAWWRRTIPSDPGMPAEGTLFEFARYVIDSSGAIHQGPTRYSHELVVTDVKEKSKGWRIEAELNAVQLRFVISIARKSRHDNAILISLKIRNRSVMDRVFLRLALPRITGINAQNEESLLSVFLLGLV